MINWLKYFEQKSDNLLSKNVSILQKKYKPRGQNVSIIPCCILLMGVHMLIALLNMYMYILGYHNFLSC